MSLIQFSALCTVVVIGAITVLCLHSISKRIEANYTPGNDSIASESIAYGVVVFAALLALINPTLTALGLI